MIVYVYIQHIQYIYIYSILYIRTLPIDQAYGAGGGGSAAQDCRECWILLAILCPSSALFFSLLSSLAVYLCCRITSSICISLFTVIFCIWRMPTLHVVFCRHCVPVLLLWHKNDSMCFFQIRENSAVELYKSGIR